MDNGQCLLFVVTGRLGRAFPNREKERLEGISSRQRYTQRVFGSSLWSRQTTLKERRPGHEVRDGGCWRDGLRDRLGKGGFAVRVHLDR